jgi:Ca2+-binding EF-hand superfamily protein
VRHPSLNRYPWTDARCLFHYDLEEAISSTDDALSSPLATVKSHEVFAYRVVNPMYLMQVSDKCQCVATVHQQDTRIEGALPYIDLGVSILKADPTDGTYTLVAGSGNCTDRQHGTEEITLEPGKYLIIPTTSGAKLKQSIESRRLLDEVRQIPRGKPRVPLTIRRSGSTDVEFSDAVINAYTELFTRMDCDHDGFLSKVEIDRYMLRTEGATIEEAAFQWMVNTFESSASQISVSGSTGHVSLGLSLPAFLRAQLYVFRAGGQDEDKLWQEMQLLGYNEDLQLVNCRAASVVVHCTTSNFRLEAIPHDEHAALEAQELVVKHLGEVSTFEDGKIKLYKYRTGTGGVTLMVENNHFVPLVFALDCTQSENVISHRGDLVHEETISPNKCAIMHVLMPEKAQDSWAWAYSASYLWAD